MRSKEEAFDWTDPEVVVVPHQSGIAVYSNPHEQIVVRVEGDNSPWEDAVVCIPPEHAEVVAAAILEEYRLLMAERGAAAQRRRESDGSDPCPAAAEGSLFPDAEHGRAG